VRVVWGLTILLVCGIVMMLFPRFSRGGLDSLLAVHVAGITLGYFTTLLLGCLATCYLLSRLFGEPVAGQRSTIRNAATWLTAMSVILTVVGIALGIYCPFPKNGWCWGLDTRELGGIAIASWNVMLLVCLWSNRKSSEILALMVMEIAASLVVVLGWLAAARIENHSYGYLNSLPMIVTLSATCGIVGLTALAPAGCFRLRKS
jgi:hypothetical protein